MRWRLSAYNTHRIGVVLDGLPYPERYFTAQPNFLRQSKMFITQDEIDHHFLNEGTESRLTIYTHFCYPHTPEERQKFIKGSFGEYSGGARAGYGYTKTHKGLDYERDYNSKKYDNVHLTIPNVVKEYERLIAQKRFPGEDAIAKIPEYERGQLARTVYNGFYNAPDDVPRPYPKGADYYDALPMMLYTQCFQALYRRADEKHNGRLPVPVRVIQDEWANVAQPESYPKILATCRSYNIGLNIIVQNIQQIKALYEKEWESIIGNCDTLLFLGGGNEPTSLEFIVKLLGKETIATRTRGQTKGRSGSSSTNFQQTGRDLMTIDEVRKLDTHKAILFIRGEDPVLDKKYNIKRHPNIKLTTDGKAKPYIHKPQGAPDYALPDLPYAFRSLDDYEFIDMEEPEHELSEKEKDFKPDKTE